jgi:glycosyltransferase involved in cell wall biosynthesis
VSDAVDRKKALQPRRIKVYAHLSHNRDVQVYTDRYRQGKEPDKTPYGFHLAEDEGFDVEFSRPTKSFVAQILSKIVRRILQFDLIHAWINRSRIEESDVIWTMTEREAFAVACIMTVGVVPKRPIISNAVWLLNQWEAFPSIVKLMFRHLARVLSVMTVHSISGLPIAREKFPSLRTELMYFGINTDVFKISIGNEPISINPIRVYSIGNDRTRDWETYLAAFGNDDRFQVIVVCWWLKKSNLKDYRNVTYLRPSTMADFLQLYSDADVVVIPMFENIYSGITVALEAVSQGKLVVCSRTGGVPTYFDESEVIYVPVGDAEAMREAVLSIDANSAKTRAEAAQRKFVAGDYSTRAVISRYAKLTHEVLSAF